ncbi:MAG: hypothetical protein K2Y22_06600 [Candidatus Obscuribacterales bacterium]|nr:hypothetical protein [Candidatus Obscuribacterales bacterium]
MQAQATQQNQVQNIRRSLSYAFINLFIVVWTVAAFIMCSPPSVCHDVLVAAIKPPFLYMGLYQFFWMYAPDPPKVYTIHIGADILYADGTEKSWEFPRLQDYKKDFYLHQSKHRYYQWKYYLFDPVGNAEILPDAALFAARKNNADPKNPPVRVVLYNVTERTLLPGREDTGEVKTDSLQKDMFFTYHIKPGEL